MAEVKWIKICTEIFDDESIKLIEEMPEGDAIIVIWFKLLIQAGKTNDCGYIYFKKDIPYTDEMLSTVFKRPLNIIRLALEVFRRFGMIEILDTQCIFISNWEKHQNISGMEQIKEYNKLAKRKQRAKVKELQNIKLIECQGHSQGQVKENHETDKEIDIDKEEDNNIMSCKQDCINILNYFNSASGRGFKPTEGNLKFIRGRLKEYSSEALKTMIDFKVEEWTNDKNMSKYLRPETLFNATKCASYIEQSKVTKNTSNQAQEDEYERLSADYVEH